MHHKLVDGQLVSFTGTHTSYDKKNRIGVAWNGGRREHGGPVDLTPFPYTFRLATVIDGTSRGGDERREAERNVIAVGDTIEVAGLAGTWKVEEPSWSNAGIKFTRVEPSIHDLFQAVREHPDYAGGTVFTREDVAGAVFGDDDGEYTPADVERVTPAMLAEAAKVIENWIMGDSVYTWSDALRENVTVEA